MTANRSLDPTGRFFAWPHDLLPPPPFGSPKLRDDERMQTDETIAFAYGCTRETIGRLRKWGLTMADADRLATRVLRCHPRQVWKNWDYRVLVSTLMDPGGLEGLIEDRSTVAELMGWDIDEAVAA